MNLLIFGATGGTGRELIRQALETGHSITAFVRNPKKVGIQHHRLHLVQGNVLDAVAVEQAVKSHDAVISALGHKRWIVKTSILSEGTKNIIAAMQKHGVKRFICVTTLGIGDSRGKLGVYYTLFLVPFLLYFYFKDKERQEQLIRESTLDWTIVRPGQLTNGSRRGVYRHGPNVGSWVLTLWISRADVADFILKQLTDTTYLRKAVGIAH